MFHSELSTYVDNDNTRNAHNGRTGNDENAHFGPKETSLRLDTQVAGVGLGPCLRRRGGGGESTAPLRPADLPTGEEGVVYVDPAYSTDRRYRSDDPEVLPFGRALGRSPFPFPDTFPSSTASTAPSSNQPLQTQYKPEQPQHKLKPYIPVPTPFEYSDDDGDDFRGYYDFDRAWAGSDPDPNMTARQQLEEPQELVDEDPTPGLSSSPSSTGSGTSCGTILTPKTPYEDQEYYDIMYKLDLGAESPYLGSAYAEAFGTHGCLLSHPLPPPPSGLKGKVKESADSSPTDSTSRASSSKHNTHCGICLRKAVSPCRTKCCDRMFCRAHISDWLRSKESSGLCPTCDTVCVFADDSSSETVLRKRRGSSTSLSPSRSRTPSSASTASASASSSCSKSGSSTRVGSFSSSATLALGDSTLSTPTTDGETEDLWDVKSAWKKNGGGSLDFVEMVREVTGDVVSGSMKFVGLSGGVRAGAGASGHHTQQVKQAATQSGTTDVERGFRFSPKELVEEVSRFTFDLGNLGIVTEVEDVDEIGEVGVAKRMVSIIVLLFVLFVLFR